MNFRDLCDLWILGKVAKLLLFHRQYMFSGHSFPKRRLFYKKAWELLRSNYRNCPDFKRGYIVKRSTLFHGLYVAET